MGTVLPEAVGELCHDNVATLLPPSGSISAMNFEPSQSPLAMTNVKEQSETLLSATSNRSSIPSDLYSGPC
ncbi:hypothetical protein F2Q68_00044458 [Brassica cretica]|uniref:Uncharacterized protein n=1 Tax=Brassica cretica TaxID=69181 RepID=A0A8S9LMC3_BRACR|nr:hypothetical protein F2Q68_00044458 [Brassica cretica]